MITEKLASSLKNIQYDKLPEEVISKAKLCFLDFLAVSLRGSKTESGEIVKKIFNSKEESTILGSKKASSTDAAFCNGIFAHCLDLDDGHRYAQLHPGCTVIPAALSLAEAREKNGMELIEAMVAGYQVSITIGKLINPKHRNNGFHSTGTCGAFGAAAAACKIMNLTIEETLNALGLAGTQASGLLESDHSGSMAKHLHAGRSAQSGVISALLAENGFTGAKSIIEGDEGFYHAMVSQEDIPDDKYKTLDENKYHILDVYFKKYPLCRHLHSSIDATIAIREDMNQEELKTNLIESIYINTYNIAAEHDIYNPKTVEDIRQSLPFAVAISLLEGAPNIDNMNINDETISLASKVIIETDKGMDNLYPNKRPSKITVKTKNNIYSKFVDLPMGEPENPLRMQSLIKKFHDLNNGVNNELINNINNFESFKINDFMEYITI